MIDININCVNFEDFVVIHRQKLGTRALHEIFNKYLIQYHGLNSSYTLDNLSTKSFSFRDMFQFYLSFDGLHHNHADTFTDKLLVNNNSNLYTKKIPNLDLINQTPPIGFSNTEYANWYGILSKLANGSYDAMSKIVDKKFEKPIIFLYKSPLQYAVTALLQDLDEVLYYSDMELDTNIYGKLNSDTHNFFKEFIFSNDKSLPNWAGDKNFSSYSKNGDIKKLYIINWLQELRELSKTESHLELRYINIMIPKLLYSMLVTNGSIGSHRTPWTSILLPIIEGNKNIIFVNLDMGDVNWETLFKSISGKDYNLESSKMIESNIKEDSNKSVTSTLMHYILNDGPTRKIIHRYYSSDFFIYDILKNDPRNYHLKK